MGEVIAGVLAARGCSALVFRGDDGLDELTTTARPRSGWCTAAGRSRRRLDPAELGLAPASARTTCAAATPRTTRRWSARCWPASSGPVRDIVLLNAAAALAADAGVAGRRGG